MSNHRILLIEPGYNNKYPPLGLMKLAAYHKGRGDIVQFVKGEDKSALRQVWDRVYITTLFSFEWKRTSKAIDFGVEVAGGQQERVFVGGIAASLMHEEFVREPRWAGVRFIAGLLDGPPAASLQLSSLDGDFGAEDLTGVPIENQIPDYEILDHIAYVYPVNDAYFGYASRGCIRKCRFCGVPKLEGAQKEMPPLYNLVNGVASRYGEKKDLVLMDNNVTASSRYKELIDEIVDLGFEKGAELTRNGRSAQRRVDFNQGVDARILCKSEMYLREMSRICISPLRIAFDHIGVRKPYETSVRMAAANGIVKLSNYMLYNFKDSPEDLFERMRINIALNEELGIRIWSFPMRYQPVTLKDRSHVGDRWNAYFLRTFQIILQATRGVVSGSSTFFHRAFGDDTESFRRLLSYPHGFIFHRDYYEYGDGRPVREEYESIRNRMSATQENELLDQLLGIVGTKLERQKRHAALYRAKCADPLVREALRFHILETKPSDAVEVLPVLANDDGALPTEEETVEDAGLYDLEPLQESSRQHSQIIATTG